MDRYQLAKLVEWAGTLRTRKCLQKVAYLLQARGAPLKVEFYLHLYGPYSSELASLTDQMVRDCLLTERNVGNSTGGQYEYSLTPQSREAMAAFERTAAGTGKRNDIVAYEVLAKSLFQRSLPELEYASTIVYFKKLGEDWDEAFAKACKFKRIATNDAPAQNAFSLAKQIIESPS